MDTPHLESASPPASIGAAEPALRPMTIDRNPAFPPQLHAWSIRPRLKAASGRCLALLSPDVADRFERRISYAVAVHYAGIYQSVPYPTDPEQRLYLDPQAGPAALPLLIVVNDRLPYWEALREHLERHWTGPLPTAVRMAFIDTWPACCAVVRVERWLRAPRYRRAWKGPPPRALERVTLSLQNKLRLDVWPPPGSHDAMLRARAEELHRYYLAYGHCHVREREREYAELGKYLDNLRQSAKRDPWRLKRFEKLCRTLEPALTVRDTRTRLAHAPDPHEAAAVTAKSGVFHERWLVDYAELEAFHAEHGHCNVKTKGWPADHPLARLGRWVHWQRVRKRDGSILPEQVELLGKLRFDFAPNRRRSDA
jgi:hypothetical protein